MNALIRPDTNLGDLDLKTISLVVDSRDVYVIIRIIPRFRVPPFVLTFQ